MAGVSIESYESAAQACVDALAGVTDRDWKVSAGPLTWSCWQTADHLIDVIFSYAFQIAGRPPSGDLAFQDLHAAPEATPADLVNGLQAVTRLMSSILRSTPTSAIVTWHGRDTDLPTWAGMGARETLLHTYDIATGLGVPFQPIPEVAAAVLAHAHPDTDPRDDPWAALVRASGRPFSADEFAARAAASEERRRQPPPPGAEEGLISDFESGDATSVFGWGWLVSTDRFRGGSSTAEMTVVEGGAAGTARSLQVTGQLVEGPEFQWAGALFCPGPAPSAPANLCGKRAVRFWARGDGRSCLLWTLTSTGGDGPAGVSVFTAGPKWRSYEFELTDMGTDGSDLQGLMFIAWRPPGPFSFQIDEVRID